MPDKIIRNIRLTIEYDGTNYCGWQVQSRASKKSIQGVIEKALQRIFRTKVKLIGSGRTDAGVHALGQVANFHSKSKIPLCNIQKALNSYLPDDIVIQKAQAVKSAFHSRFSAKAKTYRYTILNRSYPSAILRHAEYFYPYFLDADLMRKESRVLLGRHDFRSFQACDKKERDSFRTIKRIDINRSGDLIRIELEADGFLYNMVRNIVGTLIEIGRNKLPPGSLKKILLAKNRKLAGPTAPAKGLMLVRVRY
jgi:tRNA pseudouridine38-40 synthase